MASLPTTRPKHQVDDDDCDYCHCGNNPAPGQPGHEHHDACREDHPQVSDAIWRAYGDNYPGSLCRRLAKRAERASYPFPSPRVAGSHR